MTTRKESYQALADWMGLIVVYTNKKQLIASDACPGTICQGPRK